MPEFVADMEGVSDLVAGHYSISITNVNSRITVLNIIYNFFSNLVVIIRYLWVFNRQQKLV
jgi:hypothetical protein